MSESKAIVLHCVDRIGRKHKAVFNCPIAVFNVEYHGVTPKPEQHGVSKSVVLTPNATSYTYYVAETIEEIANLLNASHGEDK